MSILADKHVLIFDKGAFVWVAEKFAQYAKHVSYFMPWDSAFPHPADVAVGEGIPGVERVYDFWDAIDKADLIVFPDVGNGDMQEWLRARGFRVWGSADGQWLEQDRMQSREEFAAAGCSVPDSQWVRGLKALRAVIDETEDKWIKISLFRGAFETYHHVKPFMTHQWLKTIDRELGPLAENLQFVVESGVPGVEVGWDCHTIDGKYPNLGYCGIETKDKAIIGKLMEFSKLPLEVQAVYAAAVPALRDGKFRNYFSIEQRLEKYGGKPSVIDPCCRFGSPCTEAWAELVKNFDEVFWLGAGGELAEVVPVAQYAALAMISSDWALKNWTPIDVPKDVRPWVKMKRLTVVDDKYYYVPEELRGSDVSPPAIGVVVGIGDSPEQAIELVKERAERISGYKLNIDTDALDESEKVMAEAEEVGLMIS